MSLHVRPLALILSLSALLATGLHADDKPATKEAPVTLTAKELEGMWKDLTLGDEEGAKRAWQHICKMMQDPTNSVPFIKDHLKPIVPPDAKKVAKLIDDLDSADYKTRANATTELGNMGVLVKVALEEKLKANLPSLEMRRRIEEILEKANNGTLSPEELRASRAMEVLEGIANPAAKSVIEALAKGAPGARLTDDARRALNRLAQIQAGQ